MRTATVLRTVAVLGGFLALVSCTGESDDVDSTTGANDQEIAACETFRSMEDELGESGIADAGARQMDRMLRVTLTDVHRSARRGNNAQMVDISESMMKALAAWPLPPSIRDYPIAAAEMDSVCSALGR